MGSTYRILQLEETLREIITLVQNKETLNISKVEGLFTVVEMRIQEMACEALNHPEDCVCNYRKEGVTNNENKKTC